MRLSQEGMGYVTGFLVGYLLRHICIILPFIYKCNDILNTALILNCLDC